MQKRELKYETPRLVRAIRRARDAGLTARQVAAVTGVSYHRVKNVARRHGIRFRGRRPVVISLPQEVLSAARNEARRRRVSIRWLLASVVSTVVNDGLYTAVLDG